MYYNFAEPGPSPIGNTVGNRRREGSLRESNRSQPHMTPRWHAVPFSLIPKFRVHFLNHRKGLQGEVLAGVRAGPITWVPGRWIAQHPFRPPSFSLCSTFIWWDQGKTDFPGNKKRGTERSSRAPVESAFWKYSATCFPFRGGGRPFFRLPLGHRQVKQLSGRPGQKL